MSRNLADQLALLPELLASHLLLTLSALGAGIALTIPLAIAAVRYKALRGPALAVAGIIQTVPSLALLALMVPLLSMIGFLPAVIALILYSMLPILRNTVTGIVGVEPAMIEAAQAMGMTRLQMLTKVQLPLAAPVIIAGIRTSAVWVVGIATLSTPVGAKSLGNYIFTGLDTQNQMAVLVGCFAAAALALTLDGLIRVIEVASSQRSRGLALVAAMGLLVIIGFGLAPAVIPHRPANAQTRVVVGAKTFTEQYILAELLSKRLRDAGFFVDKKAGMGSTILFDSLANGDVDCYVDYSGTIWTTIMKRSDMPGSDAVLAEMTQWLRDRYGIECLGRLGFENAYAMAMPRRRAEQLQIRSIEDVVKHAPQMRLGGAHEFFGRPEWVRVRDAYGLRFAETVALNPTLMYAAAREGQVDVISAFSTDGRIPAFDLVVLEDPRQAFPPYDAVLLVSKAAKAKPGLIKALQALVGRIDDDVMRQANKAVDIDGQSPEQVGQMLAESLRQEEEEPG